jgi:hypothetical protein
MDVNQDARLKAQADHKSGQTPANTSNWDSNAKTAYESEWSWLKTQQDAGKNK